MYKLKMTDKRRTSLPRRFLEDDSHWFIVQFTSDSEYSDPLLSGVLENMEGETGDEVSFKVGDKCHAPWTDGRLYEADVVFEADSKEKCQKHLMTISKKTKGKAKITKPKRKNAADTGNENGEDDSENLKKNKKENNEKKKKIEKDRQQTVIRNAEQLFKESMVSMVSVPVNNINESNTVSNVNLGCTTPPVSNVNSPTPSPSMTLPVSNTFPSITPPVSNTFPSMTPPVSNTFSRMTTPMPNINIPSMKPHVPYITIPGITPPQSNINLPSMTPLASNHIIPNMTPPVSNSTFSMTPPVSNTFPRMTPPMPNINIPSMKPHVPYITIPGMTPPEANGSFPCMTPPQSNINLPSMTPLASNHNIPSMTPPVFNSTFSMTPPVSNVTFSSATPPQSNVNVASMTSAFNVNSRVQLFPTPSHSSSMTTYTPFNSMNNSFTDLTSPLSLPSPRPPVTHTLSNPCTTLTDLSLPSPRPPVTHTFSNPYTTLTDLSASSAAVSSLLSPTDCGDCLLKDKRIDGLTTYCTKLEEDVNFWKDQTKHLQDQLDREMERQEIDLTEQDNSTIYDNKGHYIPKRGIRVQKCVYKMVPASSTVPENYVQLIEGHNCYVPCVWLNDMQGNFKNKTKKCALKLMMNGFYSPKDVVEKTGVQLAETPAGAALKAYALAKLGMDARTFIDSINSKLGTMRRAIKLQRADGPDNTVDSST